jgi:peptidoglycan biosynthesis protein MviN/MurJ (putative lipid II flippase)
MVTERAMLVEQGARGPHVNYQAFQRYLETPLVVYLLLASAMLGVTYFAFDAAVDLFLPEFLPAMVIARVLIFGQMMYAATSLPRLYFNATDQLKSRLGLVLLGVAVNVLLDLLFLYLGYGALGVAIGSALSYCLYAGLLLITCAGQLYASKRRGAQFFFRVAFASGLLTLVLTALSLWQPITIQAGQGLLVRAALAGMLAAAKMLLYAAVSLLLYVSLFRSYQPQRELARLLAYARGAVTSRLADSGLWRS